MHRAAAVIKSLDVVRKIGVPQEGCKLGITGSAI
jgi:hypothetical protein